MQVQIAYNRAFKPFATVVGMGPGRSEVSVAHGNLRIRMGWSFRATIPIADVASAEPVPNPPWWWGMGAHVIGSGRWVLNGTLKNLVEVRLRRPAKATTLGLKTDVNSVIVSVEDPRALISALPCG